MELIIHSKKYGYFTVYFDEQDAQLINSCKWQIFKVVGRGLYVTTGSMRKNGKHTQQMHRLIMNAGPGIEVDHRDGNGLNNRRNNLRICSREQNARNQGLRRNSSTGFKGVSFRKKERLFECYITIAGSKRIRGGYFKDAISAARRYNELAIKYHGEFAKLNEIP